MYLGLTAFPISTRNSAIAVAHLVSKIGVRQMYVSADPAMQRLAQEANELLLAKDGIEFEALPMPNFEDLYGPGGDDALVPMGKVSPDKTCIIIHSSGEFGSGPADQPVASPLFPRSWHGTYVGVQGRPRSRSQSSSWTRTSGSGGRSYVSAACVICCAYCSSDITARCHVDFGEVDFCGVRVGGQPNPMFRAYSWRLTGIVPLRRLTSCCRRHGLAYDDLDGRLLSFSDGPR